MIGNAITGQPFQLNQSTLDNTNEHTPTCDVCELENHIYSFHCVRLNFWMKPIPQAVPVALCRYRYKMGILAAPYFKLQAQSTPKVLEQQG